MMCRHNDVKVRFSILIFIIGKCIDIIILIVIRIIMIVIISNYVYHDYHHLSYRPYHCYKLILLHNR